jgi:hypothetical protein
MATIAAPAIRPRIVTAAALISPTSSPEAAFSTKDTLVHNLERGSRRQGTLSSSGKMSQAAHPSIFPSDLPQRKAGSSLPRDLDIEQRLGEHLVGIQTRKPEMCVFPLFLSSLFRLPAYIVL